MRVLVVIARQTRMTSYQLPLGIGYVSASLKRAGHDVMVLNPNHALEDLPVLLKRAILDFSPAIITTGGMAFHLKQVGEIAAISRRLSPHSVIVIGGALVTHQPEVTMAAIPEADIGVVGEGEETIVELAAVIASGTDLAFTRGLIYRDSGSGKLKRTMARLPQENLDALPWIDFDGLGLDIYAGLHAPGQMAPGLIIDPGARVMPFLASRGCPFTCTFCCHEAAGRRYRKRSTDDVFAELEYNIDRFGINTLAIYDDLFCLKRADLEEFCSRVRPLDLRWQCSIRVEQVNPQSLTMMRESGCACISFGVESMSPTVLASMEKKSTREALDRALAQMYDAKITTWANLIFGDPAETMDTAMESLIWWIENNRYDLRTAFIGYHPGSKIYDDALRRGLICDPAAFLLADSPEINATRMSDADYADLRLSVEHVVTSFSYCGRILELVSSQPGSGRLTTICPRCATQNVYLNFVLSPTILNRLSCACCNQLYRLPVVYRPPRTDELTRLVDEINELIDANAEAKTSHAEKDNAAKIFATAMAALRLDSSQDGLWDLVIETSDILDNPDNALELLEQAIRAIPFQPQFFDQMHDRLKALGETEWAKRYSIQAAHLRSVGILEPTYYS